MNFFCFYLKVTHRVFCNRTWAVGCIAQHRGGGRSKGSQKKLHKKTKLLLSDIQLGVDIISSFVNSSYFAWEFGSSLFF